MGSSSQSDWDAIFDGLDAARDEIVVAMVAQARTEMAAYRELDADALLPTFATQCDAVLAAARTGEALSEPHVVALTAIGEARAVQGVPIEDMLRAWRVGIQVIVEHSTKVAVREAVTADVTLAFVRAVLARSDGAMVTTATAHRRAELELARHDAERRAAIARGLLLGTTPVAAVRDELRAYGFDISAPVVAVRAQEADAASRADLESALGLQDGISHRSGLRTTLDGDLIAFLRDTPDPDVPGVVGVGPPVPFDQLADSFRVATRALDCARRFGLFGAHRLGDLGLRPAIADDDDVGEALVRRFLEPLGDGAAEGEIAATLRVWFECSMHVERSAERLFVHANTVRYRLARFEELTGASLRDARTAFEVWWALERASACG